MESYHETKKYRQLMTAKKGTTSIPQGHMPSLVIQYKRVRPEKTHTNNKNRLNRMSLCICISVFTSNNDNQRKKGYQLERETQG